MSRYHVVRYHMLSYSLELMKSKSSAKQEKFYKLLQESKIENDPEKVIFNFSKYVLSDIEETP